MAWPYLRNFKASVARADGQGEAKPIDAVSLEDLLVECSETFNQNQVRNWEGLRRRLMDLSYFQKDLFLLF